MASEFEAHSGEGLYRVGRRWEEDLCFRELTQVAACKKAGGRERLAAGRVVREQWKPNEVLNWSSDSRDGGGAVWVRSSLKASLTGSGD